MPSRTGRGCARALRAAPPPLLGLLALALATLVVGCARERTPSPPLSALLITLDTTRADALSCYGGRPGITPNLDRLAAEGVRYARAESCVPLTLPSHASILTGLYPIRHGVRDNGLAPLSPAAWTLAERAQAGGLQTAAFVASVVLDRFFGLDQGFDVYEGPELPEGAPATSHFAELPGAEVVDRAIAWYHGRDRSRRFFLWVHLFDPHMPYRPPPRFSSRSPLDPYLGEVAAADDAIGRLLDALRADGGLASTVVLFVADHGEAHGEHDESTHGSYCWQTTLHVPLILRYPEGPAGPDAGRVSDELVSGVDVAPTLAEAMRLAAPDETRVPGGLDGLSLFHHAVPADRGVYFESYDGWLNYGWSPLAGWMDAKGKYLHSSEPQLFDVASDPREEHDLAATRDLAPYRRALAAIAARPRLATAEGAAGAGGDLLASIRSLGYAAGGAPAEAFPDPLAPSDRPSPASRAGEQMRCLQALSLCEDGHAADALPILREISAQNPRNAFALDRMADCLMDLGRSDEAIEPLQRLLAGGPQWPSSWYDLGQCLQRAGRAQEALGAFRHAAALMPDQPVFLRGLIQAAETAGSGDAPEVAKWRERLARLEGAR